MNSWTQPKKTMLLKMSVNPHNIYYPVSSYQTIYTWEWPQHRTTWWSPQVKNHDGFKYYGVKYKLYTYFGPFRKNPVHSGHRWQTTHHHSSQQSVGEKAINWYEPHGIEPRYSKKNLMTMTDKKSHVKQRKHNETTGKRYALLLLIRFI